MGSYCLTSRALDVALSGLQNGSSGPSTLCIARKKRHQKCNFLYSGARGLSLKNVKSPNERRHPLRVSCFMKDEDCQIVRLSSRIEAPRDNHQIPPAIHDGIFSGASRKCASIPASETMRSDGDCTWPETRESSVSGELPREDTTTTSPSGDEFPYAAARNCRGAVCDADGAGTPYMEVRCNADSSDNAKGELEWNNKSVSTASGALAEWRLARTRSGQAIVDWGRYHLQVMFVDRSHRARSRLAEGLFERIAAWNGYGLILYSQSSGISVTEGERPSLGYQGEAHRLGIGGHVFKAPATTLDRSDLDSYDLIVAVDIEVRDEVLLMAGRHLASDYTNKVRLLSEFVSYGSVSMLEDNLLEIVQHSLPQALTALEVQQTYMSQYSAWRTMVATITMCCAGLVRFLIDAYPDDLPDYDPVD